MSATDSPSTTNALATAVNSAIQAAMNGGSQVLEAAIITEVPWLGWVGIKQILEFGLSFVENFFYTQAADGATKLVIDIQVNQETSAVSQAFQEMQNALSSGDQTSIAAAQTSLDSAIGNLIHSDGSATT